MNIRSTAVGADILTPPERYLYVGLTAFSFLKLHMTYKIIIFVINMRLKHYRLHIILLQLMCKHLIQVFLEFWFYFRKEVIQFGIFSLGSGRNVFTAD